MLKNNSLENDLKESKKYAKNIMKQISEELSANGYEYTTNDSNTEFIIENVKNLKEIKELIYSIKIDRKLIDVLITGDFIENKVFLRQINI